MTSSSEHFGTSGNGASNSRIRNQNGSSSSSSSSTKSLNNNANSSNSKNNKTNSMLSPPIPSATSTNTSASTSTSTSNHAHHHQQPKPYECFGCHKPIMEKYFLKALDQIWHEDCLKCSCCNCRLGEIGSTLFTKADLILCKRDYLRMFGATGFCSLCHKQIPAFEMVMRARGNVYHLECFKCEACNHRFCVGDRFYLHDNKILCEYDYEEQMALNQIQQQQQQHHHQQSSLPGPGPRLSLTGPTGPPAQSLHLHQQHYYQQQQQQHHSHHHLGLAVNDPIQGISSSSSIPSETSLPIMASAKMANHDCHSNSMHDCQALAKNGKNYPINLGSSLGTGPNGY